eukprot:scaffold6.g2775.t1
MQSPLEQLLDAAVAWSAGRDIPRGVREAAGVIEGALQATGLLEDGGPPTHPPASRPSSRQGCVPDAAHTESCKQRGGAAFQRGQLASAAALFGEALRYCDETSGEGAALAARLYSNRALCLLRQGQPSAALEDASAAVQCDASFDKGFYRRACAHKALGRASAALADARRALRRQQEQAPGGASVELEALVAELVAAEAGQERERGEEQAHSETQANGHADAPEPAGSGDEQEEQQRLLSSVAPRLRVQRSAEAGRWLAAADALPAGQDVLRERPAAHVLTKQGRRAGRCAVCCRPLEDAAATYYCRRCPMASASYCSRACREADPWHAVGGPECGLPWPVLLPPEAVLALRLARGAAHTAAARLVASLETHFSHLPSEQAARQAALAVVAHRVWQRAATSRGDAGGGPAPADVLSALCQVAVNGLAIVPPERASAEDRLGLAIYPAASLFNHACAPCIAMRFEGCTLVARTLCPLAAGEAASISYGPQVGEMVMQQRQSLLDLQYHFRCSCPACADPERAAAEACLVGLRCPAGAVTGCDGAAVPAAGAQLPAGLVSLHALGAGGGGACSHCGAAMPQVEWEQGALPQLRTAQANYDAAIVALERLGPEASNHGVQPVIRVLREVLRQRQQLLHPRSQLLGQTHDALARAWSAAGAAEPAAQHLRHSLAALQRAYPPGATAVAFQQLKLVQLLRAAAGRGGGDEARLEAVCLLREAAEALRLHFGPAAVELASV